MTEPVILVDKKDNIALVTLNRPLALNTMNVQMATGLRQTFADLEYDESVRCVVIKGAGEHFCAGGDVQFFASLIKDSSEERKGIIHSLIADIHDAIISIRRMPKPVLTSVRGAAAGFGVSLMLAADLAVASKNAYFKLAYTDIGLSPDGGATFTLPRILGQRRAMQLILMNDSLNSEAACNIGMINWVVEDDALEEKTLEIAKKLAKGPTEAFTHVKEALNNTFHNTLAQQLDLEKNLFLSCLETQDFAEGVMSFLEKRNPNFKGE